MRPPPQGQSPLPHQVHQQPILLGVRRELGAHHLGEVQPVDVDRADRTLGITGGVVPESVLESLLASLQIKLFKAPAAPAQACWLRVSSPAPGPAPLAVRGLAAVLARAGLVGGGGRFVWGSTRVGCVVPCPVQLAWQRSHSGWERRAMSEWSWR
jgi:hypothetical protein